MTAKVERHIVDGRPEIFEANSRMTYSINRTSGLEVDGYHRMATYIRVYGPGLEIETDGLRMGRRFKYELIEGEILTAKDKKGNSIKVSHGEYKDRRPPVGGFINY